MVDLRAAVEGLPPYLDSEGFEHSAYAQTDILALIPEGAVLVTEEELASVLGSMGHRYQDPRKQAAAIVAIVRHRQEGSHHATR